MMKPLYPNIAPIYSAYCEYSDNLAMAARYPDNRDYTDRAVALSDYMDVVAYNTACAWADTTGDNINLIITHIRSLCHRLRNHHISARHGRGAYTQHYYDRDTGRYLYRDGTTYGSLGARDLCGLPGAPLLADRPANLYDGW